MEDVQNSVDTRQISINKVGIKDIKYPVIIGDKSDKPQHTIASFNMYVSLSSAVKGTHMSRFIEILNQHDYQLSVASFEKILKETVVRLEAKTANIEMVFPFFMIKEAPISKVKSLMDYEVSFTGNTDGITSDIYVKVVVSATSLCPCSKNISDYGAHNQRSHITVLVKNKSTKQFVWVEDLIKTIEQQASAQLYSVLKRPDEKFVTEAAYDNPKFVEDLVRDIAVCLNSNPKISQYTIEAENFESIHNHSAYAKIISD